MDDSTRIETRHLRYFVAVAEEMHFGRAAARLGVAQPALSRQIARLESGLGAKLFDRSHSRITLTAAGTALLPRARDLLRQLSEMSEVTRRAAAGGQGVLQVGFAGSATFSVLPDILRDYRARFPKVDLLLYHMGTLELAQALVERRIDVVVGRVRIDDPAVAAEVIRREALIVALPEGDALSARKSLKLAALAAHPFIIPARTIDDRIRKLCIDAGFHPMIAQETTDIQTTLSLVAAGLGLALVPESVGQSQRGDVVFRPLAAPRPTTEFLLSYRRDNAGPTVRAFRDVVRDYRPKKG
jgi:DNA-binding transcriptional LysR family regulator